MVSRITDERMAHMHGVAEYMYAHALEHQLEPEKMYVLGLLHDIGYLGGKDGHESRGANILKNLGFEMGYFIAILWHGSTPSDFLALTGGEKKLKIPKELILLWRADMSVDSKGNEVGFQKRLEDIGNRLGFESREYKNCSEVIEWLIHNGWK